MTKHQSIPIRSFDELSKVKNYRDYQAAENLIIDYDDLSYIRIMKLFKSSCSLPGEKEFNDSIQLENYILSDEVKKMFANSPEVDITDISVEELEKNLKEDSYHLRFYFPKSTILRRENKIKHLVIMFNGMDETDEFLLYDTLGEYFVNQGMGAVLIPTPLHLNRQILRGGKPQTPTRIAHNKHKKAKDALDENKNPRLFYYSFVRSWFELQELKSKINNFTPSNEFYWQTKENQQTSTLTDKMFYESYFGEHTDKAGNPMKNDVQFTIIGYSLGGLRALSFFLNDIGEEGKKPKSKFHSCITINTCPNLKDAHTKALNISKPDWENKLMEVARKYVDSRKGKEIHEITELRRIFLNLYFPIPRENDATENDKIGVSQKRYKLYDTFEKRLDANLNRYLAIASGSDDIVTPNQIDVIAPDHKFIHKLTIAGVNHKPAIDPNWQDLLPRVESNMLEFIQSCNDLHYTKNEVLSQIAVLVSNVNEFHLLIGQMTTLPEDADNCEKNLSVHLINDFKNDDMDFLIKGITSVFDTQNILINKKQEIVRLNGQDMSLRFLKYYYLSKSFFPHFVQTISKLNEELFGRIKNPNIKNQLCSSDITFEMIKLFKEKTIPQSNSPYPKLFANCEIILKQLREECSWNERYLLQAKDQADRYRLPFYQLTQRLNKIGIKEDELKILIAYDG